MAKKDTTTKALALSKKMATVKADAKTLGGILDRWAKEAEGFVGEVFEWGKKHKALVITVGLLVWGIHYLLETPKQKEVEDEF